MTTFNHSETQQQFDSIPHHRATGLGRGDTVVDFDIKQLTVSAIAVIE